MNLKRTPGARALLSGAPSPRKPVILGLVLAALIVATPFALYGLGVHQTVPSPAPARK